MSIVLPLLEPPLVAAPPVLLLLLELLLLPQAPRASTVPASRPAVATNLPRLATVLIALPRKRMLLLFVSTPRLGCPGGAA